LVIGTTQTKSDLKGSVLCSSFPKAAHRVDHPSMSPLPQLHATNEDNSTCSSIQGLIEQDGKHLWKLLLGDITQAFVTGPYFPNISTPSSIPSPTLHCHASGGCLFDLITDPNESADLAATQPKVVARMRAQLEAFLPTSFNPHRGDVDRAACDTAMNKYGGFFGPFVNLTA
jgi:hypothetical protein